MIRTAPAASAEDYRRACGLIRAYAAWLGIDLAFQGFDEELAGLATMYGPPSGRMILAREAGAVLGCVGLRGLGQGVCEMKRMFVLPEHQGRGIGARLLTAFMEAAGELGYGTVRLDTLPRLRSAMGMYRRAGFTAIGAYCHNPDPAAVFLECDVRQWRATAGGRQRGRSPLAPPLQTARMGRTTLL